MIHEMKGNMFDFRVDALVNPVNCFGKMGAGLALNFKKRFPKYYENYKWKCDTGRMEIGYCHVYVAYEVSETNYIISFPTKRHWNDYSELKSIDLGLKDLEQVIVSNKIMSIAIPALGCGLGMLKWDSVLSCIKLRLNKLNEVDIYVYEPCKRED